MGLCFLPVIDLRPNYGGGNEDNVELLQKVPCRHCYTQCPQPCSMPPPTHASAGDSWTLTGKSGSVSCGATAPSPGSWCAQGSVSALQGSVSKSCVSSGDSMMGLMATSSKRVMPYPGLLHPEPLPLGPATADPHLLRRHPDTVLSLSLCGVSGSWCAQGWFEPSGHLWQVWGLIRNVVLPLLPTC